MKRLKRFLLGFLAILLIFEEWLWDALTTLGRLLSRWLRLERFERWLQEAPPLTAAVAFAIPLLAVAPLNLAALWMIANGMILRGVVLEIIAKLLGTLFVARVFALTRRQLMAFRWFAWLYTTVSGWLTWAHEMVASTRVYRWAKIWKARIRKLLKREAQN